MTDVTLTYSCLGGKFGAMCQFAVNEEAFKNVYKIQIELHGKYGTNTDQMK
jgi:hypothetical protein